MTKLTNHLQFHWWKYLAIALVAIILWTTVYEIMAKPEQNEKLTVTVYSDNYTTSSLKQDIQRDIASITTQYIEQITVDGVAIKNNTLLGEILQTSLISSDILIFEQDILTDQYITEVLPPLNEKLLSRFQYLDDTYLYKIDGETYGIILCGEQIPANNFSQYYTGNKTCIAYFTTYSVNLGGAFGVGNESDDGAISLLKYLLESSNG